MTRTIQALIAVAALLPLSGASAGGNRIDRVRPDAPELAYFGDFDIGVRTLYFVDRHRPDILNTEEGGETAYYDRRLTVEVWYPARLSVGQQPGTTYTSTTRNLDVMATLHGRAVRGAEPIQPASPVPLIVISHGYPGNRYLLSHTAENLASKGYVVASIDHRDSTYRDQQAFASTLYNRPLDQVFVIDAIGQRAAATDSFLEGLVDNTRTGIIGYSMGGYGLINNLGGGFSEALVSSDYAPPNRLAELHAASNPDFAGSRDSRIKAGFAVAPWGMSAGVWEPQDLAGIRVPTFYLAGSEDDTSGYENGVRAIFENATASDRYLLTFANAGHNAGAPIPLPHEITETADHAGASHYLDAVWDTVRMNNVMDHFATAFFDYYLKGDTARREYLDLISSANDGVYSIQDGHPTGEHTYWKGFDEYTARGLTLEFRAAASSRKE